MQIMVNITNKTGEVFFKKWKSLKLRGLSYVGFYLSLERNDRPNLIKEISNINFTQLNVLNLSNLTFI